jgi:hypothetical protein
MVSMARERRGMGKKVLKKHSMYPLARRSTLSTTLIAIVREMPCSLRRR